MMTETPAAPPRPSETDGLPVPRRHVATAAILAAIALVVIDGAIANLALPTVSRALEVSPAASVWVVTGYQLSLVMFLLPCAALGESLGYRRVYTAGIVLFTLASALCALAPSLPWLIVARFLQGLGGSAIMSLGAALIRFTHPRARVGRAIGWNAFAVASASAAGPSVGATILSIASWHWLFAVNIPIGLIVLIASVGLPTTPGSRRAVDGVSVALNAAAFGCLVVGVDLCASDPVLGGGLLAAGVLILAMLIRREIPREAPLIPFDLLRIHPFRVSVIASVLCFTAQMACYVALPFHIQHTLGRDAFTAGLLMTPWPLTVMFAAPLSGRLSDRFPTGLLCAVGGTALAVALAIAAACPTDAGTAPLVGLMILGGLGFGFFQTPNNRAMLLSAPRERSGAAGGMQSSARLIGQTLGALMISTLLTVAPAEAAPRIGLALAAVLALAGGAVSVARIRSKR